MTRHQLAQAKSAEAKWLKRNPKASTAKRAADRDSVRTVSGGAVSPR